MFKVYVHQLTTVLILRLVYNNYTLSVIDIDIDTNTCCYGHLKQQNMQNHFSMS